MRIEAASEREVFADALAALHELLGSREVAGDVVGELVTGGGEELRAVRVSAPDRPALLAAWLEELVFLAESVGFVASGLRDLKLFEGSLDAAVEGRVERPPPLVKGVTYHGLTFAPGGQGYLASVVLDV